MASFIFLLLYFLVILGRATSVVVQSSNQSECDDWGESREGAVSVMEEESGWLSCSLFSHPSVYNYSSTQNPGHNLFWYRLPEGHDLEQPVTYSSRVSKDRDRLWLQPALTNDTGHYICMLRNKSSCSKIAMRLKVLRRIDMVPGDSCLPAVAMAATPVVIRLQGGYKMDCPDLENATKMADSKPNVIWFHGCRKFPFGSIDRQVIGVSLQVHVMMEHYQGLYFCRVEYQRKGRTLHFTRMLNISAVYPDSLPKEPSILQPTKDKVLVFPQGKEVRLICQGLFPYLEDTPWDIWWTVDGKTVEQLNDSRFSKVKTREVKNDFGDRWQESVLVIHDFQADDVNREFICSVKNIRGFESCQVHLDMAVSLPSVELGCGLGITLVLMLILFVVYHIFWLELLLLYRSWFGTDERYADDKEFDVYLSYARNSEEETFVLSTLRRVLENEFGYSVCIFDRDSLPGGTITDETLSFVARSRRLLVVLSPGYASQGSQALLELKAGIDSMALGGHLRVILVQYRPVQWQALFRELRGARVVLARVRWQGERSKELTSQFWKRLRVELPVHRVSNKGEGESSKDVALMRLSSQNSTSSQTGLISSNVKTSQSIYNCAT